MPFIVKFLEIGELMKISTQCFNYTILQVNLLCHPESTICYRVCALATVIFTAFIFALGSAAWAVEKIGSLVSRAVKRLAVKRLPGMENVEVTIAKIGGKTVGITIQGNGSSISDLSQIIKSNSGLKSLSIDNVTFNFPCLDLSELFQLDTLFITKTNIQKICYILPLHKPKHSILE